MQSVTLRAPPSGLMPYTHTSPTPSPPGDYSPLIRTTPRFFFTHGTIWRWPGLNLVYLPLHLAHDLCLSSSLIGAPPPLITLSIGFRRYTLFHSSVAASPSLSEAEHLFRPPIKTYL